MTVLREKIVALREVLESPMLTDKKKVREAHKLVEDLLSTEVKR